MLNKNFYWFLYNLHSDNF